MSSQDAAPAIDKTAQYALPSPETLAEAGELPVLDDQGTKHALKSLYTNSERNLIVFIRHFFCGHCEDYVRALSASFPPKSLSALTPLTTLTIIGCGEPSTIAGYRQRTGTSFPIYCDPERKLYAKLGMTQSLALGDKKPEYIQSSILGGTVKSMGNMIKSGMGAFKGGDYSQNGGEWVFDAEGKLAWGRRMANTRDHAEVGELKGVLGME